jgi:HK97 family phage prohead protease
MKHDGITRDEYVRRTLSETQRAYAALTIKDYDETKRDGARVRSIRGVATAITVDRYGDTVVPAGARYKLPLPALWQHHADQPVGLQVTAEVNDLDIPVTIILAEPKESQELIDRVTLAWESVKEGLVRGLSIGFRPLPDGYAFDQDSWTFTFNTWEWLETSLVTIPANPDAQISAAVRSMDHERRALAPASVPVKLDSDDLRRARRRSDCVYLK